MVIIEVDCFRRLEAGIVLPDDDLVAQGMTAAQIHAARMAQLAESRSASGFATAFPNDPLQSIQPYEDDDYDSEADMYVRRLSTITERTEKTEYTELPARSLASASVAFSHRRNTRALSSVTDSSYGELIGKPHLHALVCSVGSSYSQSRVMVGSIYLLIRIPYGRLLPRLLCSYPMTVQQHMNQVMRNPRAL
jgi:hypothetical protein